LSRPEDREKMLAKVYEMSQGSTFSRVNVLELNQKLGDLSLDDITDILRYYVQKGFLATAGAQSINITQRGIDYLEERMAKEKTPQPGKFSIFISRIDEHKNIADKLKEFLLKIFPENVDIFVASDPANITFSQDWFDRIKSGITNCNFMIILCTPDSVKRPWINFEAGAAMILDKDIGPICFGGQNAGGLPSPLNYIRSQAIDCSDDVSFQKHFNKFIEMIAGQIRVSVPDVNVLSSNFYQAIKSELGPTLSAFMSALSYDQGEKIVIRGNIEGSVSEHIPNVTVNLYKLENVGTGFEKSKERIIPLKSDHSFEAIMGTEDLKPGSYGATILLPSGEYTKVQFRVNDKK